MTDPTNYARLLNTEGRILCSIYLGAELKTELNKSDSVLISEENKDRLFGPYIQWCPKLPNSFCLYVRHRRPLQLSLGGISVGEFMICFPVDPSDAHCEPL